MIENNPLDYELVFNIAEKSCIPLGSMLCISGLDRIAANTHPCYA